MIAGRQPLVTVITVTYNSSRYVRDTIDSVLAQTYPDIEYIIGDDCSTDDTWNIIGGYRDPRIIAYRNEKNMREYPNRNKAIGMASGKYLIFIDGDDIIFPHGIDFLVGMMESFPQAAMAIQKNYFNNVLYPALFEPSETLRNFFFGPVNLLGSSFSSNFFRTSILKEKGLNNNLTCGDDEIRFRIAAQYPVLFVAGWVTWPRETPGQASSRIRMEVAWEETFNYSHDVLASPNHHLDPALVTDIHRVLKKDAARRCIGLLKYGKWGAAFRVLRRADIKLKDLLRHYHYRPSFTDVLTEYSPVNPFRRGFLNKL